MQRFLFLGLMLVALSLPVIFLGCSGSGNALISTSVAKTSALAFSVKWPAATRMIPQMANSIRVDILCADGHADSRILNRSPEEGVSSTTFEQLTSGSVTVTAIAFPEAGASGTEQARGQASKTIIAGQTTQITVTMNSTITRVDIPAPIGSTPVGGTAQLAATPYDVDGNIVLIATNGIAWQSNTPEIATVDQQGLVTGVTGGQAGIQATELESGVSGNVAVTIMNVNVLTVTAVHGSVTKSPNQATYNDGTVVTLTASPATGYHFTGWSGDLSGATNPAQITMTGNKTVTANFALDTYTLTITAVNGSVTKSLDQTTYDAGTVVTLTANPATDYAFTGWSEDLSGATNPAHITMTGDKTVTANFTNLGNLEVGIE